MTPADAKVNPIQQKFIEDHLVWPEPKERRVRPSTHPPIEGHKKGQSYWWESHHRTVEQGAECTGEGQSSQKRLPGQRGVRVGVMSAQAVQPVRSQPGRRESQRALQAETRRCEGHGLLGEVSLIALELKPEIGLGYQGAMRQKGKWWPDDERAADCARLYLARAKK